MRNVQLFYLLLIGFLMGCTAQVSTPTAETMLPTVAILATEPTKIATAIPAIALENISENTIAVETSQNLLEGPLIVYRIQNGTNYLLVLDIGTLTFREIKKEDLEIGSLNWVNNGCQLFTRGNVIDLQGNVVEKISEPENGSGHFQINTLSPDEQKGVVEVFLGFHNVIQLENLHLEILDRTSPDFKTDLAPNGGAYAHAWSPDGDWLAFTDFDENLILQLYRATPDGQIVEQLTSHLDDQGVIEIIKWSPDGQYLAYASQSILPNQPEGWIGLISLDDLHTVSIKPDYFQYTRGLWWSEDSTQIAFVGDSFPDAPANLRGTQMHWAERASGIVFNSFYAEQAPFSQSFGLVTPVGNLQTIFFEANDGYYLLNATTNNYEKILDNIPKDGIIREFIASPFSFSGEFDCKP